MATFRITALGCLVGLWGGVDLAGAQSPADFRQAQQLIAIHDRYQAAGQFDKAFEAAQQCLAFARERNLGTGMEIACLELVARARKNRGETREAIPLFEEIVARAQPWIPENDLLLRAKILGIGNAWRFEANCYNQLGDNQRALTLNQQAVEFFRNHRYTVEVGECLVDRGWLCHEIAQPDQAIEHLRQGLAILQPEARFENPAGHINDQCGNANLGLGTVYGEQGRYDLAEQHYRQAIHIYATVHGWNHPWTAVCLSALARIYCIQTRSSDAEPLLLAAINAHNATGTIDHPDALNTLNTLARVYVNLGRHDEAEQLIRRVIETRRTKFPDLELDLTAPLVNLGNLLDLQKRYDQAEPPLREALALSEKHYGQVHPALAEPLCILGQVRFALGQPQDALKLYDRAFEIHRQTPLPIGFAAALSELRAECLWKLGRRQEALEEAQRAVKGADLERAYSSGSERERAVISAGFGTLYDMILSWQVERNDVAEMFAIIDSRKARSFLDELRIDNDKLLQGVPENERQQLLDRERALRERLTKAEQAFASLPPAVATLSQQELQRRQALASEVMTARDALYQHLTDMRTASPLYRQLLTAQAQPITLAAVQKQLQADELLLCYKIGFERSYVVIVRGDRAAFAELVVSDGAAERLGIQPGPLTEAKLSAALQAEGGVLPILSNPGAKQEIKPKLWALWESLVPQAERQALTNGSLKLLTVLPDGAMSLLPFEALVVSDAEPAEYLLNVGPPIAYSPSASVLVNLANRQTKALGDREPLLTLGDPAYRQVKPAEDAVARLGVRTAGERFRAGLNRLPYSGWEASWVQEQFQKQGIAGVKIAGTEATEARLRQLVPGRQIVHLACHGMADENYGNFFGCLAIAPGKAGDPNDDGFLYSPEICDLGLDGCELAILSACQTNYGPRQTGEGVWNLSRAFLVAGARRVVASNWVVDDEAGATLVNNFASYLAEAGTDVSRRDYAAALQKAKQKIRQQERWSNPFYWSSLVLVGPK